MNEGFQTAVRITSEPVGTSDKPTLWWFVDDETNARNWWDFGARNSRQPNRGYLQVAMESMLATQGADFNIHALLGREAISETLRQAGVKVPVEVTQAPVTIWRTWATANLLATFGGLAMVGDSTLCVGPSFWDIVQGVPAATFGITNSVARAVPGNDALPPAVWAAWAAKPHHPAWDYAATQWSRLIEAGPTTWSAAEARRMGEEVWEIQVRKGIQALQAADGSHRADGLELTCEDLLMKKAEPVDPKTILSPAVVFVSMDGDALVRDYRYGWFVRMSREQILDSHFVWAALAKKTQHNLFKGSC